MPPAGFNLTKTGLRKLRACFYGFVLPLTPAPTLPLTPAPTPAPTLPLTPAPTPAPTLPLMPAPTPAPTLPLNAGSGLGVAIPDSNFCGLD
jgi:hypothetical protein